MSDDEKPNVPQRLEEGKTVPTARPTFNRPQEGEEFAKAQTVPTPRVSLSQARSAQQPDNQSQPQTDAPQASNEQTKK